ncbi:uncharacterized protein J3D65DRAFT_605062 [Phyllosticta citribraziliensis]|uniref:Uncharacterized protein n=1 Tax=Phyllosticta citribraziliensis TaxID=989973 RepID=A0ABR1LFN8_9PEZI
MKTSFFTAMGLLALAGLGATNPVAKEGGSNNQPRPESFNNEQLNQGPPPGRGRGRGGPDRGRLQQQQQYLFYCKAGDQGDIGQICEQCQGTPVEDPSCAPAKQGCKVKDDTCFTDQKCQQEYGQEAKAQQCGKQDGLQNNQLLSTNQEQRPERQPRPESGGSMEG